MLCIGGPPSSIIFDNAPPLACVSPPLLSKIIVGGKKPPPPPFSSEGAFIYNIKAYKFLFIKTSFGGKGGGKEQDKKKTA